MSHLIKTVCVYCGSGFGLDAEFKTTIHRFGEILAQEGIRLVYGGGGVGLMGEVASAAHDQGGQVLGIMPKFLRSREILYDAVKTEIVDTMHERKIKMFNESDAFVVFPGGIGTLEEVIELLSWRRLDLHNKPILFANINHYWDPLFSLIDHMKTERFAPDNFSHSFGVTDQVDNILDILSQMSNEHLKLDVRFV